MAYQIRFENQPSATAPAQRVTVTDTLDPNLDLSTFELTEIAFANQTLALPAGLNHYETRLAFAVTNQTLIPLGDATAFALAPPPTNAILVEVDARLDVPTRLLTLTLTTLDPLTGWYPENPLLGFLYPNDTNHVGEGSLSYLVRSKSALPSGTTITNRAEIVFDYNDPIVTPLISNTIDSASPTSTVAPLPAEAGPAILVQWSGQDDAGGSGLATYDVYVIADGTNQFRWLENTAATSAWWSGTLGSTYAFYSIARDNVGHEEAAPANPDTIVFIPTNAPVLSEVTNRMADVGSLMLITNTVTGTPMGSFIFSLAQPAPFGATINATNGILRWTPNCTQASRTHAITVLVTDTGNPNLRDARTFTVVTRECVVPELGRLVLLAGDSGRVPVNLISSVPLANLSMTVEVPAGRLTNFVLEPIVPEICAATLTPLTNAPPHPNPLPQGGEGVTDRGSPEPQHVASPKDAGNATAQPVLQAAAAGDSRAPTEFYTLTLSTCPNQFLIGTQQVAWLHFTTVSNQSSAFVPLLLDNTVGLQPDGTEVRNFAPQAGRVVVVGQEPLLEALRTANGRMQLVVYSRLGLTNGVETTAQLQSGGTWEPFGELVATNLFNHLPSFIPLDQQHFYRVRLK